MIDHEKCQQLMEEISEYVEGTLGAQLCSDLEKHLSECNNCTVVVNTLRKTIELYHETSDVTEPLPADVRDRLFMRLNLDDYLKSKA
jgi:hypothetical protein